MARVLLAMSGGVDSSASALLLRELGHEVIGVFMRHGHEPPAACEEPAQSFLPVLSASKQGCCTASDAADARRVADRLGISFYAINFDAAFARIMDYFTDEYTAGRTPNPCVACNNWIKFGKLFDYADSVGADFVATGHHARLCEGSGGGRAILRGADRAKDQSYVLFGIQAAVLPRLLFPVGHLQKAQVREAARAAGLRVADKPDSQEICFVSDGDHAAFVRRRSGRDTSGEIVATDGTVVGRHTGLEQFTVGQRKGLGVALGQPRDVVRLERESRRVVIGQHHELARREITAGQANWLAPPPAGPFDCQVQVRYQSGAAPAVVEALPGGGLHAILAEPRFGVAPGQAIVAYDGDRVLGGGWIETAR